MLSSHTPTYTVVVGCILASSILIEAQTANDDACKISNLFDHLTVIKGPECCPPGACSDSDMPGASDTCSISCGRLYEPFWDECGGALDSMGMGGMQEMNLFYEHCLETLYPPGSCGLLCNHHSYQCRLNAVRESCCARPGNCNTDSIPINGCPVGCALEFPIFVDECREHMASSHMQTALSVIDDAAETCEELDGAALVEYARDLINQGCVLELEHHRRQMQITTQWLDSNDPKCSWDDINDRSREVDEICCSESACNVGFPTECSSMCSIIFHQYMSECGAAIENILGADGRAADLHELEDTCMNNLDTHAFLEAIANAQCGDDIVGRGEVCNEAADLDITFLGEDSDSSGNGRYIRKNGDCVVTPTGVHFDGDGDYFTIDSWDYALDSTFSVSVWIVKEECTAGLYEYIYSHQNDDSTGMLAADSFQQLDHAWSTFYLGCEGQGAVTSSAEGSIMRYWVQDDAGTYAVFDYPLHDAGDFDTITGTWIHFAFVVTPLSLKTFADGVLVPASAYGFPSEPNNVAQPNPSALASRLTTMTIKQPVYVGGRADRAGDRHFRGTMAMLMVDNVALTEDQIQCYFASNEATLVALPPVVPPVSSGQQLTSCSVAITAMVSPGASGASQLDLCMSNTGPSCDGRCGALWSQITDSCRGQTDDGMVDCHSATCTSSQEVQYNAVQLKQIAAFCGGVEEGCEMDSMMAIINECELPNPRIPVDSAWRPPCNQCESDMLAPMLGCDTFAKNMGMSQEYMSAIEHGVSAGCLAPTAATRTIPTDGTPTAGEVVAGGVGVIFQFYAVAGTTYLLDTEAGTLQDTVMTLMDADQRTTIAMNDDDERETGRVDSYIEWTCSTTAMYFVKVEGFGEDHGSFSLSIDVAGVGGGGDPCVGVAAMSEQEAVISFTPEGGTDDNNHCSWLINCQRGLPVFTVERFSTETQFDTVSLFDGRDTSSASLGMLSGEMRDLPAIVYSGTSSSMLVVFDSDDSVGGQGFEASYECSTSPPPPAGNWPPVNVPVGSSVSGQVSRQGGDWFSFDASAGETYSLETASSEGGENSLEDTMMTLVDSDQQTTLAENDDDERDTGNGLNSFIEWTCPKDGSYLINVDGFGGATGAFTVSVTLAGGTAGGGPCNGGIILNALEETISFTDGTPDDSICDWTVNCPPGQRVDVIITSFATEIFFDTVVLYDGDATSAPIDSLSGELVDLGRREFSSSGSTMLIELTTDADTGGEGFELEYKCNDADDAVAGSCGSGNDVITYDSVSYETADCSGDPQAIESGAGAEAESHYTTPMCACESTEDEEEKLEGEAAFWERYTCNRDGSMNQELHRRSDCSDAKGDINDAMREMIDAEFQEQNQMTLADLEQMGVTIDFGMPNIVRSGVCYNVMSFDMTAIGGGMNSMSYMFNDISC